MRPCPLVLSAAADLDTLRFRYLSLSPDGTHAIVSVASAPLQSAATAPRSLRGSLIIGPRRR